MKRICFFNWFGYTLIILFCLCCQSINLFAENTIESRFKRLYYEKVADYLYNSKEMPQNLENALMYYKKATTYSEDKPGLEWKITRVFWVLAKRATNEKERMKYYKEGIKFGELAVEKDKNNSNAHLWYSLIVGTSAMEQGLVNTIYNLDRIKKGFEMAVELDDTNSNAYGGLAGWYYYIPAFLGGDKTKAYELIDKAINVEPNYTATRMLKADFLIDEKKYAQARETLEKVLQIESPAVVGDGIEDKEKAKTMLKDLTQKGVSM